jgi:hypothetical protein
MRTRSWVGLLTVLLVSRLASAEEPVAKVHLVGGKGVQVRPTWGAAFSPRVTQPLYRNDQIVVPANEFVVVLITGNNHLVRIDDDVTLRVRDIVLLNAPRTNESLAAQLDRMVTREERRSVERIAGTYAGLAAADAAPPQLDQAAPSGGLGGLGVRGSGQGGGGVGTTRGLGSIGTSGSGGGSGYGSGSSSAKGTAPARRSAAPPPTGAAPPPPPPAPPPTGAAPPPPPPARAAAAAPPPAPAASAAPPPPAAEAAPPRAVAPRPDPSPAPTRGGAPAPAAAAPAPRPAPAPAPSPSPRPSDSESARPADAPPPPPVALLDEPALKKCLHSEFTRQKLSLTKVTLRLRIEGGHIRRVALFGGLATPACAKQLLLERPFPGADQTWQSVDLTVK